MVSLDNLKLLLNERGRGTQEKLSKATGISSGNISDWFNPNKKAFPNAEALCKVADYFDCSVDYIIGRTEIRYLVEEPTNVIPIPIFTQKAAAGFGKEVSDDSIEQPEKKWFYEKHVPYGTEYGIIIDGDSMEPKFHDGQIVFIRLTDDCPDSQYGIFVITDNEETKVYFKQKRMVSDNSYVLHSLNSNKYKDMTDFENKIVRCVAVALH